MRISIQHVALLLPLLGACATPPDERELQAQQPPRLAGPQLAPVARPARRSPAVPRQQAVLSPAADTVARRLVFAPLGQRWFTAASRGKRLLVDIGRVDIEVRRDAHRRAAYAEAVAARSPVPVGTRLRLHGPWGIDDATVRGFDSWNGRIVATLDVAPRVDSLARGTATLVAAAELPDTTAAAPEVAPAAKPAGCMRDSVPPALLPRLTQVRDSLAQIVADTTKPLIPRLAPSAVVRSAYVPGCFGTGRVLLFVSLRTAKAEVVRERAALLDDAGRAMPLRVVDYRFKAHDPLYAVDADGDGVDDVAAKGVREAAGGTVILRLVDGKRLERLTSGFAWEGL